MMLCGAARARMWKWGSVNIADVSAYVRPGTGVDLRGEAAEGTSVFTDRVTIPMCLPQLFEAGCAACGRMRTGWWSCVM